MTKKSSILTDISGRKSVRKVNFDEPDDIKIDVLDDIDDIDEMYNDNIKIIDAN